MPATWHRLHLLPGTRDLLLHKWIFVKGRCWTRYLPPISQSALCILRQRVMLIVLLTVRLRSLKPTLLVLTRFWKPLVPFGAPCLMEKKGTFASIIFQLMKSMAICTIAITFSLKQRLMHQVVPIQRQKQVAIISYEPGHEPTVYLHWSRIAPITTGHTTSRRNSFL